MTGWRDRYTFIMKTTYRLPNDDITSSRPAYIRAWRKIAKELKSKLNVTVVGFDPDFLVRNEHGQTVDIPTWLALRIASPNGGK